MEFVVLKKSKNRKRKRNVKNKRRLRRKLEVKGTVRHKSFLHNISAMREESRAGTMDAHSFWQNYKLAQDWQQRHSVAWWKSRCFALEHENSVLRQKVRSRASDEERRRNGRKIQKETKAVERIDDSDTEEDPEEDDENIEFHVDKDMLDFLEQSIRHKMELKRSRECEIEKACAEANDDAPFVTCEAKILAKTKDARSLYGEASPGIMAMEAALQATIDRHKDRADPRYWPHIPLKL